MKAFFISSTFKDMQSERDILHERVFPRLRKLIKEYGDEVQEVDLRWGVDTVNMTEEESGHEVLKICIDAIDRCKPYLIVLLGERYGWIPGRDIVDSAKDTRISDRYEAEMSITELEIQYGALLNSDSFDKCVFCFRDPAVTDKIDRDERAKYSVESPRHKERLTALKKQIREREGAIIMDYSADWDSDSKSICGLERFEEDIYFILEEMIKRDFADSKVKSRKERQAEETEMIKNIYLSSYVRRYAEEFAVMKLIGDFDWNTHVVSGAKEYDCAVVSGGAGTGKSALMAFVASEAQRNKMPTVLCFASASGCRTPDLLKNYIVERLEALTGEEHKDNASADESLRVLNKKAEGKGYVCFVDAIDQIYGGERDLYIDLPALCPNVFWVFSTLPDLPWQKALGDYRCAVVKVDGMYKEQREKMVAHTAGKRGKKLDDETVRVITDSNGADNPLFISLVLQRFFMMNKREFEEAESMAPGMEGLRRYMGKMLGEMPDTPHEMAAYILDVTAKIFGQKQFSDILVLIALSKGGLSENELSDLLKLDGKSFSPIGFQQTVSYLYDAFSQTAGGKWTFSHRLFGEAVISSAGEEAIGHARDLLIRYSEENEGFMEKEGFHYLLEGKSDSFAKVMERSVGWDTKSEVHSEIGCLARDSEAWREFFKELTRRYPTEGMAEFWLGFEDFFYGEEVEELTHNAVMILLDSDIGDRYKWQLALTSLYRLPKEEAMAVTERAEQYCAAIDEPYISIARTGIYSERCRILTATGGNYAEIGSCRNKTFEYADRAVAVMKDNGELRDYCKIFRYVSFACRNASSWDSPDALSLWKHALELVESAHRYAGEDDVEIYRITFMYSISKAYCKKQFRDYEKAKEYGEKALELAEKAVSLRPTVRNLDLKIYAVYAFVERLKEEYQYPYLEQAMDCARRAYATQKGDYYKRELAYAECRYACSIAKAINTRNIEFKQSVIDEADGIWDHGFALFEELTVSGYDREDLFSYAAYLADRSDICRERGYMNKAETFAVRALELLEDGMKYYAERAEKAKTEEARGYEIAGIDWCKGWIARVKGTVANVCMSGLDLAECEKYADEAAAMSLERAEKISSHYRRAVDATLLLARAKYCQRKDSEALEVCERLAELLSSPRAESFETDLHKGEENYIRARIALERGQVEEACNYLAECEKCPEKYVLYHAKLLILKADLLTAKGDAESARAWRAALKEWRRWLESEKVRLEKDEGYRVFSSKGKITRRAFRRESREYALAAYYTAYCYYHCAVDEEAHRELYRADEKDIFEILSLTDHSRLNGLRPELIKVGEIKPKAEDTRSIPVATDTDGLTEILDGMTDTPSHSVDPLAYRFILENSRLIDSTVPTAEQINRLKNTAAIMYDSLSKERVAFAKAIKDTEIVRYAFRLGEKVPVYCRQTEGYRIWTEKEIAYRPYNWQALTRLLLFILRFETDRAERKRWLDKTVVAYMGVSDLISGGKSVEQADISVISDEELTALSSAFYMEDELRNKGSFINWYQLKNVWTAELQRRRGDGVLLEERLAEFEEFLTDRYEELYQTFVVSEKKNMVFEVTHAAMHLIRMLTDRGCTAEALRVAKWMEADPRLKGRMMSGTVSLLVPVTDSDRQWLEEIKTEYCKKWLGGISAGFWTIRVM